MSTITYRQLSAALAHTPYLSVSLCLGWTVIAYVTLTGYDLLALRRVAPATSMARTAGASLLAYSISQTLGFALVTGNVVRARFWSAWGLRPSQIASGIAYIGSTFLLGVVSATAIALLSASPHVAHALHLPLPIARIGGALLAAPPVVYLAVAYLARERVISVGRWRLGLPNGRFAMAQIALGLLDWTAAGAAFAVLVPHGTEISVAGVIGAFVLAQAVGVVSHVPGGLGVFESVMVVTLGGVVDPPALVSALIVYRVVYYLVPFGLAVLALVVMTPASRRFARGARAMGSAAQTLLPTALAITTFIGGTMLLCSGATPPAHGRLRLLESALPLGVVELSHFSASIAGVGLLVLASALHRKLDAAWGVTIGVLLLGIVTSLLKGLDYEEAIVLTLVLALLIPARAAFYRQATLTSEPLGVEWLIAVAAMVGASVYLGMFAYRHVEYSNDLWWEFAARGNVPRFLRASAGAVAATFAVALWRLLRHAPVATTSPTHDELRRAARIAATVHESGPALAQLGDKRLLFNAADDAFVMYGVAGRSWIAMGDPVGLPERAGEIAWRFKESADMHGAWPVFYQVTPALLPVYVELGLSLLKIGEEATVPLAPFTLEGGARKWMRRALKDADEAGLSFEIVAPADVDAILPELRAISDEWLGGKRVREKGFSLGRFDAEYVRRFPVAIVRAAPNEHGARAIVAFANIWCGSAGGEIAPDLMRRRADAPRIVMDILFIRLLLWGKAAGFSRANLGMSPLGGIRVVAGGRASLAPLWTRIGAFVYRRGEPLYNFRGLRAYKDKFDPIWTARYIACPRGIALPARSPTRPRSLPAGSPVSFASERCRDTRKAPADCSGASRVCPPPRAEPRSGQLRFATPART